jgi:NAD(P)-dependent dehydrogenase (short-subunit alcohol dehydrogenase family)
MSLNPKITQWGGRVVWLLGASTGIGNAAASALHARGARVVVSARNAAALQQFCVEHPGCEAIAFDATDHSAVRAAVSRIVAHHGRIDLALYCAGTYQPMRATQFDLASARQHLRVNYEGALLWLDALLPQMLRQADAGQGGHLSLVGSVAGYRGLPKALAYGPTKAALINLAETLYQDLAPRGLGVSIVNPGFVQTPLTAQNDFRMPALMTPQQAAEAMLRGWEAGDFEIHFPKRFTRAMKALRLLQDNLFFALMRRSVVPPP